MPRIPGALQVYRDSSAILLSQTLSKYFRYTDYYHWQAFDASCWKENRPDVVVYEVERSRENPGRYDEIGAECISMN